MTDTRQQLIELLAVRIAERADMGYLPDDEDRAEAAFYLDALLSDEGRLLMVRLMHDAHMRETQNAPGGEGTRDISAEKMVEYLKERGVLVPDPDFDGMPFDWVQRPLHGCETQDGWRLVRPLPGDES